MDQKITTFIAYDGAHAEAAAQLYVSIFETDCRIENVAHGPDGKVITVTFRLFGTQYIALNSGGPDFAFTNGVSLMVMCDTQAEIDRYWSKLTADGGQEVACGWCRDKFGMRWQITPRRLMEMIRDQDRAKATRAFNAMMTMKKLDIAALEKAFNG